MKVTQTYMFACWLGGYNATNKTKFRPGTATPEMVEQYARETKDGKSWGWYTKRQVGIVAGVLGGAVGLMKVR